MQLGRSLSGIIHGDAKVGKSWVGDSGPVPRLILDAEGGTRFTPSRKVGWNPLEGGPPAYDGTWDTCVVPVLQYSTLEMVYQWLVAGQHEFRSITWDHVTEIQQKLKFETAGMVSLDQQDWGLVLTKMATLMRQYRDLTMHPTRPLESVIFLAATSERDDKYRPHVQGQLATMMPYFTDFIGYMFVQANPDGQAQHRMIVSPHVDPRFLVGDRTGRLPAVIDFPNVNNPQWTQQPWGVETMLDMVYGPRQEQGATA